MICSLLFVLLSLFPRTEEVIVARYELGVGSDGIPFSRIYYNDVIFYTECEVFVLMEDMMTDHCNDMEMQIRRDHLEFQKKYRKL